MLGFDIFSPLSMPIEKPEERAARKERERLILEEILKTAEPWADNLSWRPSLVVKGETWDPRRVFQVESLNNGCDDDVNDEQFVDSANGQFRYVHKLLPRGRSLVTYKGSQRGIVRFDTDVIIPALFERLHTGRLDDTPWMSVTPMELMTLRTGTKLAKGNVVVAGLGLGHQLIEVSKKKSVKSIILVEKSQELVDFIYPAIREYVKCPVEIMVGDAYKVLPTLTADVALIDIFGHYGNNGDYITSQLRRFNKNIKNVWCWGSAKVNSDRRW